MYGVNFYSEEIFSIDLHVCVCVCVFAFNGLFSCLFHNNRDRFHLEEYLLHVLLKIPSTLFLE